MLIQNGNLRSPITILMPNIKRKRWSKAIIPKITDAVPVNGFIRINLIHKDNYNPAKMRFVY